MSAVQEAPLFDLDDFEETRIEWVPVYSMDRCRDCGARCAANQGGVRDGQVFVVCDPCASLDRHWGGRPDCWGSGDLLGEQARRRARYLSAVAA